MNKQIPENCKRVVCYEMPDGSLVKTKTPPGHEPGAILRPLVELPKDPSMCWEWQGKMLPNGYGCKNFNGKTMLAHRWVWAQFLGRIPEGLVIDHQCSNRSCVNPFHLRIVTQAENCRDGVNSVLTPGDVQDIRKLRRNGWGPKAICERLNIPKGAVDGVIQGRSWRKPKPFYGAKKNAPNEASR